MRDTLDQYFMKLLPLVAARSTCRRRAVGCVLADARGRILAAGYNGVPTATEHCLDTPCPGADDAPGDSRRCLAIHAEQNALLNCGRLDLVITAYVSCSPCFVCAKLLLNLPALRRVVVAADYTRRYDIFSDTFSGEPADASGRSLLVRRELLYLFTDGVAQAVAA